MWKFIFNFLEKIQTSWLNKYMKQNLLSSPKHYAAIYNSRCIAARGPQSTPEWDHT